MQAGRRYTFYQVINWTKRSIFFFIAYDTIVVGLYYFLGLTWIAVPWQPISLIGIAVAFYLGFKNNSSYERLWEGRKIWGGIVNASRSLTIMVRDFVTNEHARPPLTSEKLTDIHKQIVYRHIAWLYALTFQLRKLQPWEHNSRIHAGFRKAADIGSDDIHYEKIKPFLSGEEYEYIMSKGNRAANLLSLQSRQFLQLKLSGLIEDFRHMELEKMMVELYALQGKSERLKNFPFPRQYASANFYFVCIFIILLPFSLLGVFGGLAVGAMIWLAVPFTALASWVFWLMEAIGEYSENPFEGLYNDVPITSMARGIERDLREMMDETDLPDPILPMGPLKILY